MVAFKFPMLCESKVSCMSHMQMPIILEYKVQLAYLSSNGSSESRWDVYNDLLI